MEELISVIIPVYNVEEYLKKCIDSIINQTYSNLEILLIDDGSTDNSGKICDEYKIIDKRIKVIHKENGGVSSARNLGISEAKGKWLTFIDSDDWIETNFCEILINEARENNADVVLCAYNRVTNSKLEKINVYSKNVELDSIQYLINILNPQTGFGFCHMKLYKSDIIKNIRFNTDLEVGEDALFNEKISQNIVNSIYVNENLYNYRVNEFSVVRKYDERYCEKYLKAMKATKKFIFNNYINSEEIKINYYNFVAYHVLLIAVNYCYNYENKNKNKREILKNICKEDFFKEAIKKSNYNKLSLTRKIALFTLKFHLYFVLELICQYRQYKNRSKRRRKWE